MNHGVVSIMKYFFLIAAFILFSGFSYAEQDSINNKTSDIPAKKLDNIYQLFEITNIKTEAEETIDYLFDYFKQLAPNLPDGYLENLKSEFTTESYFKMLAPIYDRAFSDEELQKLIVFFKSDIGNKWISSLPQISNESYMRMQEWQTAIAIKLRNRIEDDGYIKTTNNKSGGNNE